VREKSEREKVMANASQEAKDGQYEMSYDKRERERTAVKLDRSSNKRERRERVRGEREKSEREKVMANASQEAKYG